MTRTDQPTAAKRRVLFICTGNACRSQMAEALLRHLGGDRFEVCSAGSKPAGFIHALAIEAMARMGVPMEDAVSKSWDEFADQPVDLVVTVCDNAAGEPCPVWPGTPRVAHWGLPDPSYHPGTPEERLDFAMRVAERLRTKLLGLIQLDWSMDDAEVDRRLKFLGEI